MVYVLQLVLFQNCFNFVAPLYFYLSFRISLLIYTGRNTGNLNMDYIEPIDQQFECDMPRCGWILFIHSFLQEVFIEHPLCCRLCAKCWDREMRLILRSKAARALFEDKRAYLKSCNRKAGCDYRNVRQGMRERNSVA